MQPPTQGSRRPHILLRAAAAVACAAALVSAFPATSGHEGNPHHCVRGATVPPGISDNGQAFQGQAFDYVIVGGGTAGLVLAARLTENVSTTVAVIEAGPSGLGDSSLTTPAGNLYASSVGTNKDWAYKTTPQSAMGGRSLSWPRGKVLGGSSAINGLYLVRQPAAEQNGWAKLLEGMSKDASAIWRWENVLAAMKKSETYTPLQLSVKGTIMSGDPGRKETLVPYDQDNHGETGPVHYSYPAISYQDVGAFLQSVQDVSGLQISQNAYGGNNTGPFLSASSINPSNWTRSFARTAYLDPIVARPNLHVLTGHQATKIIFDHSTSPPTAKGITFSSAKGQPAQTIHATGEVILAAGAIGSPQLLQLSGVGDKSILGPLGIAQEADVPGVGFHLQDHVSTAVTFSPRSNVTVPPSKLTGNAKVDSFVNSATGFIPLNKIVNDTQSFLSRYRANIPKYVQAYDAPDTVKAGFNATSHELSGSLYPQGVPAVEILLGNTYGSIQVQCALQHPVSRGSVKITSTSAFDYPQIDAGYLLHEEDKQVLREGCRFAREVGTTWPLSSFTGNESSPGRATQSDGQWDGFVGRSAGTEYHPSSSNSMLPLELGGVVDEEFRVYHTQNLRVIDSSVLPMSMSQHLMTVTYALAEIGAEMLQAKIRGGMYQPTTY